jgi:sulfate permease, SulP family
VNAMTCQDAVLAHVDSAEGVRVVVIDMEGTNVLDTTSVDMLSELVETLHTRDIDAYFVRVRFPVRDLLRRSGVMAQIGEDHVWHSISQGVRRARADHGIDAKPRPSPDYDPKLSFIPPSGEDEYGHRWSPFGP